MGWDIDRFPEGEVNLELICCICTCILEDPVESPCRHVFCSQCIKTWLSNQKSCPHCRAAVHKRDLQSVVPLLKNIISKQRIYCDNKERGCNEIVALESLLSHVAVCQHGLVSCTNDGCIVKIMRKDMKTHSEICSKRTVLCEEGCEMFLKLGERGSHNCVQALRVHFQEVQNEMMSRISKLEELVNMLVAGKNINNREVTSRSTTVSDTYNCAAPYSIPSPRACDRQPPPYTVFADANDVNSTINLTEYSLEQNDLSEDSVASLDSDNEENTRDDSNQPRDQTRDQTRENDYHVVRVRNRQNTDTPERAMSPVYDHLERPHSSERFYLSHDGRLLSRDTTRQRSRSPQQTRRGIRALRNINSNRENRQNRTYDRTTRASRDLDDEPLVLRIGVSQTVSDSSTSSSSSSDSETD